MAVLGISGAKTATSLLTGKEGLHYSVGALILTSGAKYTQLANIGSGTQTIVNITGSGVLTFCYGITVTNNTGIRVTITLDGTTVYNANKADAVNYGNLVVGSCYQGNGGTAGQACSRDHVPFNTSMLITAADTNSSGTAYLFYDYFLT